MIKNKLEAAIIALSAAALLIIVSLSCVGGGGGGASTPGSRVINPGPATYASIRPRAGLSTSSHTLTFTGTGFSGATMASLESSPTSALSGFSATTDTKMSFTVPSGLALGPHYFKVALASGTFDTGIPFRIALPSTTIGTVTSVSPAKVSDADSSIVTIIGSGFLGATAVRLNDTSNTALTGIFVVDDDEMDVVVPSGVVEGIYDVLVTNAAGANAASEAKLEVAKLPAILSVSPSSGQKHSVTTVSLTGINFTGATSARLSDPLQTSLTNVTVVSNTQMNVTIPSNVSAGTWDFIVTNAKGSNAASTGKFSVTIVPEVSAITPQQVVSQPGTVTLTGRYFTGASAASITTTPATSLTGISAQSDTSMTAVIPASVQPGAYNISVTTPEGTSDTSTTASQVFVGSGPVVSAISPAIVMIGQSATLTITGALFTGATKVEVDDQSSTQLTNLVVNSGTQLTVTVPTTIASGLYNVRVTTSQGTNATSAAKLRIADVPAVTDANAVQAFNDNQSLSVTLTGTNFIATNATGSPFTVTVNLSDASSAAATNVTVVSDTSLTCSFDLTGGGSAVTPGLYSYRVTTSFGTNTSSAKQIAVFPTDTASTGPYYLTNAPTSVSLTYTDSASNSKSTGMLIYYPANATQTDFPHGHSFPLIAFGHTEATFGLGISNQSYAYLINHLCSFGVVVATVTLPFDNGCGCVTPPTTQNTESNIEGDANALLAAIDYVAALNTNSNVSNIYFSHIDTANCGFGGHGRGASAAIAAGKNAQAAGDARIQGVFTLAPMLDSITTNNSSTALANPAMTGSPTPPNDAYFLTMSQLTMAGDLDSLFPFASHAKVAYDAATNGPANEMYAIEVAGGDHFGFVDPSAYPASGSPLLTGTLPHGDQMGLTKRVVAAFIRRHLAGDMIFDTGTSGVLTESTWNGPTSGSNTISQRLQK
ncbi:MAG: IPT/TIG domain-containing protein [Planctomycetes bacterium]|nr:IPT/TIG domain-containing protein [Planctomycetota bacterium]